MGNECRMLSENLKRETTWRQTRGCEDNIKVDLKEMRCEDLDLIHLGQDKVYYQALTNTEMSVGAP
jgi:hypothetical protein